MSTHNPKLRYWDTSVFLGYLKGKHDQRDQCDIILAKANSGETTIVTSAITLAEVVWYDPQRIFEEKSKQNIRDIFDYPYIQALDYTRFVAERARELKWKYRDLEIKDAGHLSTVIESEISLFESYDLSLLEYDKVFHNKLGQEIRILEPFISGQFEISF
ncbi:MAG: PIN domain-containing protein [Bacteroidetes bacterium]|nr:PIN domain-containing protein [Bacteroidota bacterium]MCY4233487.1 PIN domain-containing protein [Bacteroidota bacterium]